MDAIWVVYKNMIKGKKSIANSYPQYRTHMPTVI